MIKTKKDSIKICTAIPYEVKDEKWYDGDNAHRFRLMEEIIQRLKSSTDLLVLPAGFLSYANNASNLSSIEQKVTSMIIDARKRLTVCFGIDYSSGGYQYAIAINRNGIRALEWKFYQAPMEEIITGEPFQDCEEYKPYFDLKGKRALLTTCYDVFGIAHGVAGDNPFAGTDVIVNLIHRFSSSLKGNADFARKGMAGAAKLWDVHVYASAPFLDGKKPHNWTSAVKWKNPLKSVRNCSYDDIRIKTIMEDDESVDGVLLRYFEE